MEYLLAMTDMLGTAEAMRDGPPSALRVDVGFSVCDRGRTCFKVRQRGVPDLYDRTTKMLPPLRQLSRPATIALRAARRPAVYGGARVGPFVRTIVTKRYTQDHEVVVFDDSTMKGTVHITDYAQSSLGDVVFVELPTEGTEVSQGDQIGAVESVKAASDIYAPVSGEVEEVNSKLAEQPGLLNKSPEDQGWLCRIKIKDAAEIEKLMDEAAYKVHCES